MSSEAFGRSVELPVSAEQAFAWHEREGVLDRLTPHWEELRIESSDDSLREGARVVAQVRVGPSWQRFVAEHRDYEAGRRFRDVQVSGPFERWEHEHRFEPIDEHRCRLVDRIEYALPGGRLAQWLTRDAVARRLAKAFAWRHRTLELDLKQQAAWADREPLTVAVTGASGLIGSAMVTHLKTAGHRVRPMVRRETEDPEAIEWNTSEGVKDPRQLDSVDAVIHLAGENIGQRWTAKRKQAFRESRVQGTAALVGALEQAERRPRTLLSTSAVGYYGDRGDEPLTEANGPGAGFLGDLAEAWEAEAAKAEPLGVRVARMRLGVVLTPRGGALGAMLTPFRFGGGGVVGSGNQYMSWVSIDDVTGAFLHALHHEQVSGPVNVGSPSPVTNREFTRTLGRVLHRPTALPMPARALRLALGEMADEMLLASARMEPTKLRETEYAFRDTELEQTLRWLLGRGIG